MLEKTSNIGTRIIIIRIIEMRANNFFRDFFGLNDWGGGGGGGGGIWKALLIVTLRFKPFFPV